MASWDGQDAEAGARALRGTPAQRSCPCRRSRCRRGRAGWAARRAMYFSLSPPQGARGETRDVTGGLPLPQGSGVRAVPSPRERQGPGRRACSLTPPPSLRQWSWEEDAHPPQAGRRGRGADARRCTSNGRRAERGARARGPCGARLAPRAHRWPRLTIVGCAQKLVVPGRVAQPGSNTFGYGIHS